MKKIVCLMQPAATKAAAGCIKENNGGNSGGTTPFYIVTPAQKPEKVTVVFASASGAMSTTLFMSMYHRK
ncbi:MAG: hypothetical protein MR722_05195 [Bacteroidales bacterium]|nr:hypothetical protein [Bacteroidales bacterium]